MLAGQMLEGITKSRTFENGRESLKGAAQTNYKLEVIRFLFSYFLFRFHVCSFKVTPSHVDPINFFLEVFSSNQCFVKLRNKNKYF